MPGGIAEWDPSIPIGLAADAGRVEAAVAALARRGISALLRPLLRAEAVASSRIEGLRIGHERLARAAVDDQDDPLAHAVLGNIDALRLALDLARRPVTVASILDLHRALLAGTRDAVIAGRLRDAQNWIGGQHPNPRGAVFVPPPEGEVPRLLDDLCRFCERDDLPPSLQAAVAHVQFETIHPFADGNGRVGRALVHVALCRGGLTADGHGEPVPPPLSLAFAADPDGYVAGLTAFRAGDHRRWLELFLSALHRAVELAEGLAADVAALQGRWRAQARSPRRRSAAEAIIERLPEQPVLDLRRATALTGASGEAARRAIDRLVRAGVLREFTGGRRDRRWQAIGLLELLDRLEAARRGLQPVMTVRSGGPMGGALA